MYRLANISHQDPVQVLYDIAWTGNHLTPSSSPSIIWHCMDWQTSHTKIQSKYYMTLYGLANISHPDPVQVLYDIVWTGKHLTPRSSPSIIWHCMDWQTSYNKIQSNYYMTLHRLQTSHTKIQSKYYMTLHRLANISEQHLALELYLQNVIWNDYIYTEKIILYLSTCRKKNFNHKW